VNPFPSVRQGGSFRSGWSLIVHDDLVYRVYSNIGRRAFATLRKGMFVVCRIVPVHPATDAWLVSGHLAVFPQVGPT
jgi:hypothetical protein